MALGGKRVGAGRKKGLPNKATQARQAKIAAEGVTPLDVLIDGMRFHHARANEARNATPPDTDTAARELKEAGGFAKEAAPYVHPKLATVEHAGKDGGAIKVIITGADRGLL
jgi:hypothetical protein